MSDYEKQDSGHPVMGAIGTGAVLGGATALGEKYVWNKGKPLGTFAAETALKASALAEQLGAAAAEGKSFDDVKDNLEKAFGEGEVPKFVEKHYDSMKSLFEGKGGAGGKIQQAAASVLAGEGEKLNSEEQKLLDDLLKQKEKFTNRLREHGTIRKVPVAAAAIAGIVAGSKIFGGSGRSEPADLQQRGDLDATQIAAMSQIATDSAVHDGTLEQHVERGI